MEKSPDTNVSLNLRLDRVGAFLSLGCAVHCLLMPLVLALLPLGGLALFLERDLEVGLIFGTVGIALVSILWGFLSHRKFRVLILLGTALGLIYLAQGVVPEPYEPWTMAAAGFFLATTHLINIRLCKTCPSSTCHDHV